MTRSNTPIRVRLLQDKLKPNWRAALKDFAPIVTGIGTFLLAIISFYYVHTQDREKSELAINEIRQKALSAVNEADPTKQDVGAMSVAIYGKTAIPVIRFLLRGSTKNPNMRPFAVVVVQHWFESEDSPGRADVINELLSCARAESPNLREGSYAALAGISETLSKPEDDRVLALLQERFGAANGPAETDPVAARIACPLLNKYDYSATRAALLAIARLAPDQALQSYATILNNAHSCQSVAHDISSLSVPAAFQQLRSDLAKKAQGCPQ